MEREQPSRSDSNAGTGLLEPETATTVSSDPKAQAGEAGPSASSTIATRVDRLAVMALSVPELRLARVKALQTRIEAGTYQVPAGQVAEALLEYMRAPSKAGGHRQSFGA